MIILDTNAVHDLDPHSARADLIRMLRKAGLRVGAPWVVVEELTAHKLYEYQREFELMLRHYRKLKTLRPNFMGPEPKYMGEEFSAHWRKQYEDVFEVVPTNSSALQAAVLREAACMKPAKVDKSKKAGGRDVAVWFSILDYLSSNPYEKVHFVTTNTADFGQPDEWPFPLDLDLSGNTHRIEQILDFEDVLNEFAEQASAPEGLTESLTRRLSSKEATEAMALEAWRSIVISPSGQRIEQLPPESLVRVAFDSIGPAECRKIGDSVWYSCRVKWQLLLFALESDKSAPVAPLTLTWDTSILFSEDESQIPALLRSGSISQLSPDQLSESLKSSVFEALDRYRGKFDSTHYAALLAHSTNSSAELMEQRRRAIQRRLLSGYIDSLETPKQQLLDALEGINAKTARQQLLDALEGINAKTARQQLLDALNNSNPGISQETFDDKGEI